MTRASEALRQAHMAIADASGPDDRSRLVAAKCRALMVGYDRRYHGAGYVPLEIEQVVVVPLVNPDTNRISRTFAAAGKLDIVAMHGVHRVLFDHKTTSDSIHDPDASYWDQLLIEGQVSHYMLLKWQQGEKIDEAVWDVMHKPSIAPKKLTKSELRATVASREYFGRQLTQDSLDALQRQDRETLELYEARLVHDCTIDRPHRYFQRRTIPRLDRELLEYAQELWEHGQEILHARNTERHARNSGACMLYGSPCKFLGICSGRDNPDSDKWVRKQCVHTELDGIDGDGRDLITNSRVRTFQTCRRKHYYAYELGIERLDEEERETLYFGSLWHRALAAWWSAFLPSKELENVNCDEGSPVDAVGQHSRDTKPAYTG